MDELEAGTRMDNSLDSFSTLSLDSESSVLSDEDLLTLILLRVPIRKVMCFASVSKLWHCLITSPHFRNNANHTAGLFFQINISKPGLPNFIYFLSLHNHNHPTSPFTELPFISARDPCIPSVRIVHSCAGYLLCSSCPINVPTPNFRYYIYNPTTNHILTLPKNDHCDSYHAAALAFDPSKSPHFRVFICATPTIPSPDLISFRYLGMTVPMQKQFYIYSSQTGTWRSSGQRFIYKRDHFNFKYCVYFNGCIHWISETIPVSEVDNCCYYYNLDKEKLETMPTPPTGLRSRQKVTSYIGVSQNHLHIAEVYACDNLLNVYEMKNNYSGWFLKYEVDLSPISQVFPDMTTTPDQVYILSLVRRENSEEDSFLVLHIPGKPRKAIHYNLVDKSFKGIWDFSYPEYITKQPEWVRRSQEPWPAHYQPRKFQAFEFIESLTCL